MTHQQDLRAIARTIIDSNQYMTLGTADEAGQPWVSPVWYAAVEYREFFWVSSPEAMHSRNLATRPQVSIVIFDSQAPIGTGQAVYLTAFAEELEGGDLDRGMAIFSRASVARGARVEAGGRAAARPPSPVSSNRGRTLGARSGWAPDSRASPGPSDVGDY